MTGAVGVYLCALALLPASAAATAGTSVERTDPASDLTVGVGTAVQLEQRSRTLQAGVSAFVEGEAAGRGPALEWCASLTRAGGGLEVDLGLLLKWPLRLSPRAELMPGLGPQLVWAFGRRGGGAWVGVEVAADLMYWLLPRAGVWLEPTLGLLWRNRGERSFGFASGVMARW